MIIGIPKEIKTNESRVSMIPSGVKELVQMGHQVLVEKEAGQGSGFADKQYGSAGATLTDSAEEIWEKAELIVKVKEPIQIEYTYFREGMVIFTFLHLAADRPLTKKLLEKKVTGIAYETIELSDGTLPLLTPMSEVAGRIGAQEAANLLAKHRCGKGILMGGVAGVSPARVLILGGGVAGTNAARVCLGMGAIVTIMDVNLDRLRYLDEVLGGRFLTLFPTKENIEAALTTTDIVIGCVLVPGAKSPHLITKDMLNLIGEGSVIVDIAIDQGGCSETSQPTTHEKPTYVVGGVIHYCVANMPAAMPRTSTQALSNATLPYILKMVDSDLEKLLKNDRPLQKGLNTFKGDLTNEKVAQAFGMRYKSFSAA